MSLVDVKETKKHDDSAILCVIPFLLHLAANQVDLFVPIVDKVLDTRKRFFSYFIQIDLSIVDRVLDMLKRFCTCKLILHMQVDFVHAS